MIEYVIGALVLLIVVVIYTRVGLRGRLRKFVIENNLRPKKARVQVSVESLRQTYLIKNEKDRVLPMGKFKKALSKNLKYQDPDKTYSEDGSFWVNEDSPLLIPPEPTTEYAPLPDGWTDAS